MISGGENAGEWDLMESERTSARHSKRSVATKRLCSGVLQWSFLLAFLTILDGLQSLYYKEHAGHGKLTLRAWY